MTRRLTSLLVAVVFATALMAQVVERLTILPQPTKMSMGSEKSFFEMNPDTKIVNSIDGKEGKYVVAEIQRIAEDIFGKKLKTASKVKGNNNIIIKCGTQEIGRASCRERVFV